MTCGVFIHFCREALIASDVRAIAAGPLFYPLQSVNHCQDAEFADIQPRYKTSPSAARCDESSCSVNVADFLVNMKLSQTGKQVRPLRFVFAWKPS